MSSLSYSSISSTTNFSVPGILLLAGRICRNVVQYAFEFPRFSSSLLAKTEFFLPLTINTLVIPRSRLKFYGDRAFSVCAPKLWNNLPEHIKCSTNLRTFTRSLKTHFLSAILIYSFVLFFNT